LHWVSIQHALETEVRLYDRLFIDEAPDSHKEKTFRFYESKFFQVYKGFVEPSLVWQPGEKFQFQRLGYFNVDKDSSVEIQLSLIKTVIKRFWEEKGKRKKIY
jgi:glutaminyl-tRNA synthetase